MYKTMNFTSQTEFLCELLIPCSDEFSCDIIIFDKMSQERITDKHKKVSFLISVLENKDELTTLSCIPNAWILRQSSDKIKDLITLCKKEIEAYQSAQLLRRLSGTLYIHMEVHEHNIGMIREGMRTSAKEIREIFEAQVAEMRQIHTDIFDVKEKIGELPISIEETQANQLLEENVEQTEDILARTDKVIKAMFKFVSILQCEDRITQMLDGICNVIDSDKEQIQGMDAKIDDEQKIIEYKKEMVQYYTIQEQRDFVNGITNAYGTCRTATVDIDDNDFTLF